MMLKAYKDFILWEASSRELVDFKPIYVDITGNLIAGLLLSQLIYWFLPNREGKSKLKVQRDDRWWLCKSRTEWYNEIRITARQYDSASDKLVRLGIIERELFMFGGKTKIHLTVNFDKLIVLLNEKFGERGKSIDEYMVIEKKVVNKPKKNTIPIADRIASFAKMVNDYVNENLKYDPVKVSFIKYWTEPNKSGTKFRYEDCSYFDLGRRLGTFLKSYTKNQRYNMPEKGERNKEYRTLSSFKNFEEFIEYYKPFQQKSREHLLPYSKDIKDLSYAYINRHIGLDYGKIMFNKLRRI
jgi:hypothetical protein